MLILRKFRGDRLLLIRSNIEINWHPIELQDAILDIEAMGGYRPDQIKDLLKSGAILYTTEAFYRKASTADKSRKEKSV